MDPVSISGREGRTVTGGRRIDDQWNGYQWNIPLDEIVDCDSAPECCRNCYYNNKGMSKKKKSVIVFFILALSVILASLVVRFSLGSIDIILGIGDQRPIISQDMNFSPLLCSSYSMVNVPMQHNPVPLSSSSLSSSRSSEQIEPAMLHSYNENNIPLFDAYMLLDTPYRSYQTSSYTVQETMAFPSHDYFNYWASHFDSGSEVTISLCPDLDIELHLVEGKGDLDKILKNRQVTGSVKHTFSPCSSFRKASSYHFSVASSPDTYAFVFTIANTGTPSRSNTSTVATFSFRRKELVFDEVALYASCKNTDQCLLPVPNKASSIMIEMKQNATAWPMTIRTECIPSIGMYFAFFLGIPAGAMVFLGACGGILYLCQMSVMNDIERAERRRRPHPTASHSASTTSSPPSVSSTSGTMSRLAANRRAFRTTTSPRSPLVDHDVLSAMAEVNRHYDLPPTYNEVEHVSSPVEDRPPPSFEATQNQHAEDPPSYDSIMT